MHVRRVRLAVVAVLATLAACAAPRPVTAPAERAIAHRFVAEWTRVGPEPSALRTQIGATPFAFFRFVNAAWTREVCRAFADVAADVPVVRLHGDAHVEQYAVTRDARGLDDFDESASGPAFVDLTRFVGSLELAAAQRGWTAALPLAIDAFFDGYRRGLDEPAYLPAAPAVVRRVRATSVRPAQAFLAWADTLMAPLSADDWQLLDREWPRLVESALRTHPDVTRAFLTRKATGWLHMGIGSALTPKLLFRIEGPTLDADDDVILEAKEVGTFADESCVTVPRDAEAARAVEGIRQIGRLPQQILVVLPGVEGRLDDGRGWWVRAWDPSYGEMHISDLASAEELRDVAHDVGAQLGSANLPPPTDAARRDRRRRERDAVTQLEPRIRQVAHTLAMATADAFAQGRITVPSRRRVVPHE